MVVETGEGEENVTGWNLHKNVKDNKFVFWSMSKEHPMLYYSKKLG